MADQTEKKDKKEKKENVDSVEKMKRNLASKAATSTLGKKLLSKALDDEANSLMKAVKKLVELQTDRKKAKEVQNTILRLLVKAYRQIETKKLTEQQFAVADRPLRKAFRRIVRMTASYDEIKQKPDELKENFAALETHLKQVQSIVNDLLNPYISEKNKKKFAETIDLLCSHEFLSKIWADERSKPELQKLSGTMKTYLQRPSRAPKQPTNKA